MAGVLGVFVGLTTLDVVHRVARVPRPNEKLTAVDAELAAGGPAANAAKTFAALGGRARLITALGGGPAAVLARSDLERLGVEIVDADPDAITPIASVLVSATGERAIVGTPGSANIASADFAGALTGASVLLLDGHHPRLAVPLAAAAQARGLRVVVDAGRPKPVFADLLPFITDAICSADFRHPADAAGPETAENVLAAGVARVALTAGAEPIRWWERGGAHGRVVPPAVDAADTLGAGDVLHGAFCWQVASGRPFPDALARACVLASERCATVGLGRWLDALAGAARWTS